MTLPYEGAVEIWGDRHAAKAARDDKKRCHREGVAERSGSLINMIASGDLTAILSPVAISHGFRRTFVGAGH